MSIIFKHEQFVFFIKVTTMKRLLLAIFIVFYCFGSDNLSAQIPEKESSVIKVSKAYQNSAYPDIFNYYPDIKQITVEFEHKRPVSLRLHYTDVESLKLPNVRKDQEYYDLEFEGDKYLFDKKYTQINLPILPHAEVDYMSTMQQCKTYYSLTAVIFKDSVKYKFSQQCPSDNLESDVYIRKYIPEAKYKGDIRQMAMMFEKNYDKQKHQAQGDSTLIFQGIINRDGSLCNVELQVGEKSPFATFIQQGLEKTGKSWDPMLQGGRSVRSLIDIYVRLDSEDRITVSASGKYRDFAPGRSYVW